MICLLTLDCKNKILITIKGTIDVERFAGLSVHISALLKLWRKYVHIALVRSACCLVYIIKKWHLYSWESFHGTLETVKNVKP